MPSFDFYFLLFSLYCLSFSSSVLVLFFHTSCYIFFTSHPHILYTTVFKKQHNSSCRHLYKKKSQEHSSQQYPREKISECRYPGMPTETINIFCLSDILGLSLFLSSRQQEKRRCNKISQSIILFQNKFRKGCTTRNTVKSSTSFMTHTTFFVVSTEVEDYSRVVFVNVPEIRNIDVF